MVLGPVNLAHDTNSPTVLLDGLTSILSFYGIASIVLIMLLSLLSCLFVHHFTLTILLLSFAY